MTNKKNKMKRNYLIKNMGRVYLAVGVLAATLLSSCYKDTSPGAINFGKSPALVGFQYLGFNAVPLVTKIHGTSKDTTGVQVSLSVASLTLKSAVTVQVTDDPTDAQAYVNAQNAATPGSTALLPSSQYTINNGGAITIQPGQTIVSLRINFKGNLVDFSNTPVMGLKITSANGATIATNLNVAILTLTLQSIYEGHYTNTGSMNDVVTPSFDTPTTYPESIDLLTASAYVVDFYDLTYNIGYGHPIEGGASLYGSYDPEFTFDPATNKITGCTNAYGQGSGAHARSALLDPSGVNAGSGTPGTIGFKIQVKYILYQGDLGTNRTYFNETYTYLGPAI
jgi:hypothetical protein